MSWRYDHQWEISETHSVAEARKDREKKKFFGFVDELITENDKKLAWTAETSI